MYTIKFFVRMLELEVNCNCSRNNTPYHYLLQAFYPTNMCKEILPGDNGWWPSQPQTRLLVALPPNNLTHSFWWPTHRPGLTHNSWWAPINPFLYTFLEGPPSHSSIHMTFGFTLRQILQQDHDHLYLKLKLDVIILKYNEI